VLKFDSSPSRYILKIFKTNASEHIFQTMTPSGSSVFVFPYRATWCNSGEFPSRDVFKYSGH
jgi:hypothetical protein